MRALRSALVRSCVGVCIVAAAGVIALGLLLRRAATHLAAFVEMGGDRADRPAEFPSDEFRRLEIAVAAIPKRMARLRIDGRRATAMIAHDLRTSVTRVRTAIESALAQELGGNTAPDALPCALRRCDELADLLAALLRISEVAGAHAIGRADLDLVATAEFLFEAFEPAIVDGGRTLRLIAGGPVRATGDRALIVQALANLLDNAQLHTPKGTAIEMGVERIGAEARIWISDDGPGVPAMDRSLLTEPFFRTERGRSVAGHGLGLSMVAAVCAAHHGRIVVTGREVGDGLRVELLLPAHAGPENAPPLFGGLGGGSKAKATGRVAATLQSANA